MTTWKNLYPSETSLVVGSTAPVEQSISPIDLREEFNELIFGGAETTPIGQKFIFRRMRRDDDNNLIACICLDETTKHPSRSYPCQHCYGRGYLWDEELVTGYKTVLASTTSSSDVNLEKKEYGQVYLPATRFYLPYDVIPTLEDRLVEIQLESDGTPVIPYVRLLTYELVLVRDMRGANGKIEYWICNGTSMGPKTLGNVG